MKAKASADWRFAPATVFAHVRARLTLTPARDWPQSDPRLRPALVLIGLAAYPDEAQDHSHPTDGSLAGAFGPDRLSRRQDRRAGQERRRRRLARGAGEIGLDPRHVEPLGYLDPHTTGTGFRILPVVAKVTAPVVFKVNPDEVDEAFEVPFAFLIDSANHALHHKEIEGKFRISMRCPMARGTFGA
jgi:hypothetical protein